MQTVRDVVIKARSHRRFASKSIEPGLIDALIDVGRQTPSAGNLQRLKFTPVTGREHCALVYPALRWAGYLEEWDGPVEEERPAGYIVIWHDTSLGAVNLVDVGIVAQAINMVAYGDMGLTLCMIGAFDKGALKRVMGMELGPLEPVLVLAIGYEKEVVKIDEMRDGNVRYWRDSEGVHHVPKRSMDEVLVRAKFQE